MLGIVCIIDIVSANLSNDEIVSHLPDVGMKYMNKINL